MAIACREKIDALQIDDRYKQAIDAFCSDPNNESACQLLCDAPPDVIAQKFQEVEGQLADWVENGVPEELGAAVAQKDPQIAAQADALLKNEAPQVLAQERAKRQAPQGFAQGGLASLGRFGDNNMVHAQKGEVVVPNHVLNDGNFREVLNRKMMRMGANPERYTVGGRRMSVNPRTGRAEFFSLGGVIGGIAGVALAPVTGGASLALYAGLGAAAGTLIDTGDIGEAALMGLGAYGLTTALVGAGVLGGAAGAAGAAGAGTTAAGTAGAGAGAGAATAATPALGSAAEFAAFEAAPFEAISASGIGSGVGAGVGGATVTGGQVLTEGLGGVGAVPVNSAAPVVEHSALLPSGAVNPATTATAGANAGGSSFLGDLATSASNWWNDSSMLEKAGAVSMGTGLLGMSGALDAEMPERPAGYDLQTDPSAQYGGKSYETLGPDDLFANIDQLGSGVPGTPGTPIGGSGTVSTVSPSGYSYGATPTYGSTPNFSAAQTTYNAATAPWAGKVPSYAAISAANGGHIRGAGTATSDSIPARLSDGEFVLTAKAVRGAGNGSLRDGARKLYAMMDTLERNA